MGSRSKKTSCWERLANGNANANTSFGALDTIYQELLPAADIINRKLSIIRFLANEKIRASAQVFIETVSITVSPHGQISVGRRHTVGVLTTLVT